MRITSDMIHPQLRLIGGVIRRVMPHFSEKALRRMSALQSRLMAGHWPGKRSRCFVYAIPRADDSAFRLLVIRPKQPREGVPGVLWMHGGGYALGLPEQDAAFIERFTDRGCVVVAPDYMLSVDKPYPAAIEDCYLALLWMKDNAEFLGIRDDQIFVGGDSAGGGLTAALTLLARDRGEVAIAFQMPLYPMIDDRPTASSSDNDAPIWNSRLNESSWKMYLGDLHGGDVPAYAAPARAENLRGLPPACTYVGTIEPFYAETVAYVRRLREAGVPVKFREFEGCFHGFDIVAPGSGVAKEAQAFLMDAFDDAVKTCFAPQKEKEA